MITVSEDLAYVVIGILLMVPCIAANYPWEIAEKGYGKPGPFFPQILWMLMAVGGAILFFAGVVLGFGAGMGWWVR